MAWGWGALAALLHDRLGIAAIPRNPSKPGYFHNYGLSPEDDSKLTTWMVGRLGVGVWPKEGDLELITIERAMLSRWKPPLNLKDVDTPWSAMLRKARKRMAAEARTAGGEPV